MSCDAIREKIILLLYGELDTQERALVENHASTCTGCRVALAGERRLHAMLVRRPPIEPSEDRVTRCRGDLAHALRAEARDDAPVTGRRPSRSFWPVSWALPSPAFALVFLIAGFVSGWLTVGQGLLPVNRPADPAGATGDRDATAANLKSLEIDPAGDRVNLIYDTRTRSSIEGRLTDPEIRRRLVETVRGSSNAGLRLDAIDLLERQVAEADVRQALVGTLREDRNAGARLKALAALDDRAATDLEVRNAVIDALLRDDNLGVRVRAIDALARTRHPELMPVMRRLARDDADPYIRRRSSAIADEMYASVNR